MFIELEGDENTKSIDSHLLSNDLPPEPAILDEPLAEAHETSSEEPAEADSLVADDIHGTEIKEFAKMERKDVDEVWRLIKSGQLIARTENGVVYVYGTQDKGAKIKDLPPIPTPESSEVATLPPLPIEVHDSGLPLVHRSGVSELTMLLEHLTIAKEENRQIMQLSQESIARITSMSEEIVKAKENIIKQQEKALRAESEKLSEKEAEIAALKSELSSSQTEKRKLRQEVEDLEMLTNTLNAQTRI